MWVNPSPAGRADVKLTYPQPWRLSGKLDANCGILEKQPPLSCILSGKLDTVQLADSGKRSPQLAHYSININKLMHFSSRSLPFWRGICFSVSYP